MKTIPINTLENITCPCCFESYPISDLLIHDPDNTTRSVLPSRFTTNGYPRTAKGLEASSYVCPHCRFDIPLRFLEHPSIYISMVGAPASGKTHYTVAMYREMLNLEQEYQVSFSRADISTNDTLRKYYRDLYQTDEDFVQLEKTQTNNPLHYHNEYPKPYIFEIQDSLHEGVFLNIYDQAGEDWDNPKTSSQKFGHLKHKDSIIFIFFDPCQNIAECVLPPWELVTALKQRCQRENPKVFVLATKLDKWITYFDQSLRRSQKKMPKDIARLVGHLRGGTETTVSTFDEVVLSMSESTRQTLSENGPDYQRFIGAVDDLSNDVTFFPLSSTGCDPQRSEGGAEMFQRSHLAPCWVRTPLVYALRTNSYIRNVFDIPNVEMTSEE